MALFVNIRTNDPLMVKWSSFVPIQICYLNTNGIVSCDQVVLSKGAATVHYG